MRYTIINLESISHIELVEETDSFIKWLPEIKEEKSIFGVNKVDPREEGWYLYNEIVDIEEIKKDPNYRFDEKENKVYLSCSVHINFGKGGNWSRKTIYLDSNEDGVQYMNEISDKIPSLSIKTDNKYKLIK